MKCNTCKLVENELVIYKYTEKSGNYGYIVGTSFPEACKTLIRFDVDLVSIEEFDRPWLQENITDE